MALNTSGGGACDRAFTRTLRRGMAGADVRAVKERLLALGMYAPHITALKKDSFGTDTYRAVCAFQTARGLPANGEVDMATHAALFGAAGGGSAPAQAAESAPPGGLPGTIGAAAANAIGEALGTASPARRGVVLDALQYAFDPAVPRDYPLSLYIRGGNLYNSDLAPNVITLARNASGAARPPQ